MESDFFVLDSSAVIAYYNTEDPHHSESLRISEAFSDKKAVLHPFVIQEVATAFAYRFGPAEAEQFFADIRGAASMLIPVVQVEKDIAFFEQVGKKMSFTDLALVRLAKEMRAPLFTFDKQILSLMQDLK
ncbi:MAG: type II toxin-antitoxin system VapC family toxin [Patescibacteria group bacterium]